MAEDVPIHGLHNVEAEKTDVHEQNIIVLIMHRT
jgi:hypothetical protein